MHTVFALLCFVVVIHWLIFPYPSGLRHWHCGNLAIAPVPAKQPWWIWINTSCEFIMNDCITTTKQSTKKTCAYFLGYTVYIYICIYIGYLSSGTKRPICMMFFFNYREHSLFFTYPHFYALSPTELWLLDCIYLHLGTWFSTMSAVINDLSKNINVLIHDSIQCTLVMIIMMMMIVIMRIILKIIMIVMMIKIIMMIIITMIIMRRWWWRW